ALGATEDATAVPTSRGDGALTGGIAPYATYATRDGGYMTLGALEPKFWTAVCKGVGIEADMTALLPGPHQAAWETKLAAIFAARTRSEWEAFARERDACLEPVLRPEELAHDPQLAAREVLFDIASPWGKIAQFRTPLTPRGAEHRPPPRQGEH